MIQVAAGVLSSLAVAVLSYQVLGRVLGEDARLMDQQVADVIYRWRSPMLTKAMMVVTNLGAAYPIAALVLVMIPVAWRKHRKEVLTLAVIFIMGVLIHTLLKGMFQRPRPTISPLVGASGYSYPSGHAMNSVVFYSASAFFFHRLGKRRILSLLVALLSAAIVLLTGLSRVYLGVHHPSDVVAGYVVGAWWLVTALLTSRSAAVADLLRVEEKMATPPG